MSSIGIQIQGSQYGGSINVESMRDRLTTLRDRLQQEIDNGNGTDLMADRLDKISSQIDRLDRLDGKNVNISASRAKEELEHGMQYLSEGMKFLQSQGDGESRAADRISGWYDHLASVYRTIDRHA